jgi:ABC-type transporter Mla subunit MlaD
MPLQDFTPELRTRLNRVERMVGWFVIVATIILIGGFAYYLYATAQSRGWFVTKINYATALNDAGGFKVGNPVKLMGFDVGEVSQINLNSPELSHGLTIFFTVREPYYDYIWYDSHVLIKSDLLGNRYIEITKGEHGVPSVMTNKDGKLLVLNRYLAWQKYKSLTNELGANSATNNVAPDEFLTDVTNQLMGFITNNIDSFYTNVFSADYNKPIKAHSTPATRNYYWIPALDTPALEDRLNAVANEVEVAMPHILGLTNQLAAVLSNANQTVNRLNAALAEADPILTNLNVVTGNLRDPNGSLGNWLIPTNLAGQLHETLQSATAALKSAHTTLDDSDTNVTMLATDLDKTLQHLSDLTSNLAWQVQMNTNLITDISTTIEHTDGLVQGLKREWFLRGAFKAKKVKHTDPAPTNSAH